MWAIVTKTSNASMLINATYDMPDGVRGDENGEDGFEGDLLQDGFDETHFGTPWRWEGRDGIGKE